MIPSNSFASLYVRMAGDSSILSSAHHNLIVRFERVSKSRTHTFFANNAQTEFGVSNNFGAVRHYTWNDTVIDCRHCPALPDSDALRDFDDTISGYTRFEKMRQKLEGRMGGFITIQPFYSVLRGEDNMRYNICRKRKVEDFDIVRIGLKLSAVNEEQFNAGLKFLNDQDNPFILKTHLLKNSRDMQMA